MVLKNSLLLDGVLYTVLDLVRGLFCLEVYQTAGVLSVFEDMNDGVRRPFALIAGVVAAGISGASRKAGFGEGTPQQVSREGQNRRIADFGTVVETCSK